jgi:UPF0716 family protein affecting phage T7 exclusion
MRAGRPGNEVMQGAMIVLASILLLIPGFVTDAVGLLLFVPPVREASRPLHHFTRRTSSSSEGGTMRPRNEDGVVDLDADDWKEDRPWSGRRKPNAPVSRASVPGTTGRKNRTHRLFANSARNHRNVTLLYA